MTKSSNREQSHNTGSGPVLWIYNPWIDMVVGCGAWSGPLLLLAYFSIASNTLKWSIAFYGLALFFNYPHYMATVYRAYHRSEDFNKYRIFTVHITLLVLVTVVLSHFWARALPFIFTLYQTWSPWHYSGQNYGIFMMFTRRAGARPSNAQRRSLYAAFLLSYRRDSSAHQRSKPRLLTIQPPSHVTEKLIIKRSKIANERILQLRVRYWTQAPSRCRLFGQR